MSKPLFKYSHYDLKLLPAGSVLEVTLSAVNNVRLMTPDNFQRFTELLDYKYLGGTAKKSPMRFSVPESGHWHLIVDAEGHGDLAQSSAKMLTNVKAAAQPQAQQQQQR